MTMWISIRRVAKQWLEENAPEHWALPMFQAPEEPTGLSALRG